MHRPGQVHLFFQSNIPGSLLSPKVSTSRSVSRHQIQAGTILRRYIVFVILVFSTFCFAKKLSENGTASFFFGK